jgi:hypothetical protein
LSAAAGSAVRLASFGWFPGREALYFSTYVETSEYPVPNDDLHIVEGGGQGAYQWLAPGQGGRLSFSPDGRLLAVSNRAWIDVLDLAGGSRIRAVEFPAIANYESGYLPQMVWAPDSSGFKAVVPPAAENGVNLGPAQFLYVFPNGTVATLASFALLPLYETLPLLSPDGTYIIYAALSDQGKAVFLMDSSGATRPYSEISDEVRIYGWAPDSKHFLYGVGVPPRITLGDVGATGIEFPQIEPSTLSWIEFGKFIIIESNSMVFRDINGTSIIIDSQVSDFEFIR